MGALMDINPLSNKVIGAAIEVHKTLGPGLLESAYEESLCWELTHQQVLFERQKLLPLNYKGHTLDCGYRLDILVDNQIILELKSIERIEPIHKAQLLTYLKLSGYPMGLLLNFNIPLMRDGIVRLVNQFKG
jgi:GxxExxY protein